jgi:hypothetical protein
MEDNNTVAGWDRSINCTKRAPRPGVSGRGQARGLHRYQLAPTHVISIRNNVPDASIFRIFSSGRLRLYQTLNDLQE